MPDAPHLQLTLGVEVTQPNTSLGTEKDTSLQPTMNALWLNAQNKLRKGEHYLVLLVQIYQGTGKKVFFSLIKTRKKCL